METPDMKYTGRIIKELREKAGENQEQLAAALQVANRETVARWESGARDLKREHIIALAKHFNVSADYLLGLSDVASVDEDVQTACKVTGLSEQSIIILSDTLDEWKDVIAYHAGDTSEQYKCREEMEAFYQALDRIISSYAWRDLAYYCVDLSENSKIILDKYGVYHDDFEMICKKIGISEKSFMWYQVKHFSNFIAMPGEEFDETPIKECDLNRYNILRLSEKISDMFDRRREYMNYSRDELLDYLEIDEEKLDKMRKEANNGNHNPTP